MYFRINNQKDIIKKAINKAGSYRKLSRLLKIPRSSLVRYFTGEALPENRFKNITKFLKIKIDNKEINKLQDNWKQILGGKKCVESKKKKGTFNKQLKKAQIRGAIKLKEWHKNMKEKNPRQYYLMQYNNFKKINGYKFKTKKGEKVRNSFEMEIANILNKMDIEYEYEPLIKIENKYFFPDFLINKKIIIECTMWRGETKAYKLKEKIKYLKKRYKVFVIIPKNLYTYYKILNNHLILGLDEFVPVAQTFLQDKN